MEYIWRVSELITARPEKIGIKRPAQITKGIRILKKMIILFFKGKNFFINTIRKYHCYYPPSKKQVKKLDKIP